MNALSTTLLTAIRNSLITKFGEANVMTACSVWSTVWSVASIASVFIAAGMVLGMLAQEPTVSAFAPSNGVPTIISTSGKPSYITSPVTLGPGINKVLYTTRIYASNGTVVYKYPDFLLEHDKLPAMSFKVPTLEPGTYFVRTKIKYALNPLRSSELEIELARLVVLDPSLTFIERQP